MAIAVAETDVCEPGVLVDDEVSLPAHNAAFPSGLTLTGGTNVLQISIDRTRGDYGTELILGLDTYEGQRLFSEWMLSDDFTTDDTEIGRHVFLRQVDSLRVGTVPLQGDLIASLGASEQAGLRVVLDNRLGFWTRLLAQEVLLTMTVTIYVAFSPDLIRSVFRGQVSRVTYQKSFIQLEFSEP